MVHNSSPTNNLSAAGERYEICAERVETRRGASWTVAFTTDFPIGLDAQLELRMALEQHRLRIRTNATIGSHGGHMQCIRFDRDDTGRPQMTAIWSVIRRLKQVLDNEQRRIFAGALVNHAATAENGNLLIRR